MTAPGALASVDSISVPGVLASVASISVSVLPAAVLGAVPEIEGWNLGRACVERIVLRVEAHGRSRIVAIFSEMAAHHRHVLRFRIAEIDACREGSLSQGLLYGCVDDLEHEGVILELHLALRRADVDIHRTRVGFKEYEI